MESGYGWRRRGRADSGSTSPARFIEHPVSKLDTLAGVAIKYGVEVADVKRMNGLVTDLQMFALEKLLIPRPGRHPPSNGESSPRGNGDGISQSGQSDLDVLEEFLPLKSKTTRRRSSSATICKLDSETEGTEMSVYRAGIAPNFDRDNSPKLSPVSEPLPFGRRKSKSFINGLLTENSDLIEQLLLPESRNDSTIGYGDVSVGRLHKGDVEPASTPPPELILKEDNSNGGFSGRAGTNLALRPKSATRSTSSIDLDSPVDANMMLSNPNSVLMGVLSSVADGLAAVRKSSPTLSLFSTDTLSSFWPTSNWTLKPDLQSVTATAITRPILDGLPNPITGRRSKAALD